MSAVSMTFLTPTGRPCSGPRGSSSSRARAVAIALSGSTCVHARSSPSRSPIRSRHSRTSSSELSSRSLRSRTASVAVTIPGRVRGEMIR